MKYLRFKFKILLSCLVKLTPGNIGRDHFDRYFLFLTVTCTPTVHAGLQVQHNGILS